MINPYVHRKPDAEFIKRKLDIKDLEELEKMVNITKTTAGYPRYSNDSNIKKSSLDILKEFGHIDLGERLHEQWRVKIIPKKKYKNFKNSLKPFIKNFVEEGYYDKAISEIEYMFERTEEDIENLYFLRALYAKSLADSDNGRKDKINKLINLEKRLSKFENKLIGLESDNIILNILEDCKENNDKDLVSRMLKFVSDYYNRKFTI